VGRRKLLPTFFMSVKRLSDKNELIASSDFKHGSYAFSHFNRVQSRVFEVHNRECNCVIAAPTGVGKTVCAEMFMADEIRRRGGKTIYLAPLRALAKEKIDEWTGEESVFSGLKLAICTGDYRLTDSRKKELEDADVIVMTSEMLSSRCRNMDSEKNEFLKDCGTLVVDESHLLTVPGRGDHLEVGLMKFSKIARNLRIVFLSATMPNVDEIANWVACSLVRKETYLIVSSYRPCPLDIHYEEYEVAETYDQTEDYKVSKAVDIVRKHKSDKFLVFVHSKITGERIRKALEERGIESEFHNADLNKDKRHALENRFKHGDLRVVVATSTLAWGVNLPSRRVIIAGVHRGMSEVENYDIMQMAGRAGRPGYDPRGDVHILIPDRDPERHVERIGDPKRIESQLLVSTGKEDPHYKTLAFHIVSEIHHGNISTKDDLHEWYGRSLAYFQYEELDDSIADKTLDLLIRVGAIKEVDGKYEVTSVGKVSSMMYYSPFDVADLRRNFKYLFANGLESNDLAVCMALGNVDSIRMGFVSKAEKEEMESFASQVKKAFGEHLESTIKGAHAYYCLLNGLPLGPFASVARGLQMDFDRLASVLSMLDSMAAKWNKSSFFRELSMRISYGVRPELVDLCRIPGVGRVRAERLFAAGFKKPSDLLKNPIAVKKILNMKDEKVKEIIEIIRNY
jgi:replicative superfamily II helicase